MSSIVTIPDRGDVTMTHRRWTKKKQAVQGLVFGRSGSRGLRCRSSLKSAPWSRTELEKVWNDGECARTATKVWGYRVTPRVVGTCQTPFEAVFELGWRGRQPIFAVALSSRRGVVGGDGVDGGSRGRFVRGWGERKSFEFLFIFF